MEPAVLPNDEDASEWTPATVDEARELEARAADELGTAQNEERLAQDAFNTARRNQTSSTKDLAAFDRVLPMLETAVHGLTVPPDQPPYDGTAEAATSAARQAVTAHSTCRDAALQTERKLEGGVSGSRKYPAMSGSNDSTSPCVRRSPPWKAATSPRWPPPGRTHWRPASQP